MANTPIEIIGFSTVDTDNTRNFIKTNVDLCNADLLNAFSISPGDNKFRPAQGTLLRKRIFEQYYSGFRDVILSDVTTIVGQDPRLELIGCTISEIPYGLVIALTLNYIQLNTIDTLLIPFNNTTDGPYGYTAS